MNEEEMLPAPAKSLPLKKAFRKLSSVLTLLPKRALSDNALRLASQSSLESKFYAIPTDATYAFRSHWIRHESLGAYDRLLAAQRKGGTACYFVYQTRIHGKIRTVVRWVYLWLDDHLGTMVLNWKGINKPFNLGLLISTEMRLLKRFNLAHKLPVLEPSPTFVQPEKKRCSPSGLRDLFYTRERKSRRSESLREPSDEESVFQRSCCPHTNIYTLRMRNQRFAYDYHNQYVHPLSLKFNRQRGRYCTFLFEYYHQADDHARAFAVLRHLQERDALLVSAASV